MTHETAGDPVSGLKWTHRTTVKLAHELRRQARHEPPRLRPPADGGGHCHPANGDPVR